MSRTMPFENPNKPLVTEPLLEKFISEAFTFIQNVKHAYQDNGEVYLQFGKIMKAYLQQSDIPKLQREIVALFKGQDVLLAGFKNFLPKSHPFVYECVGATSDDINRILTFLKKLEPYNKEWIGFFETILKNVKNGSTQPADFCNKVAEAREKHPEIMEEFLSLLPKHCREFSTLRDNARKSTKEPCPDNRAQSNRQSQPVFQLSQNSEKATYSYRRLPGDCRLPNRSSGLKAVLNDTWIQSPVSDSTPYKHALTVHEDVLRLCEDDRYELDLCIARANSTIAALERLLKAMGEEENVEVDKYLTGIHERLIESICGGRGHEVVRCLQLFPKLTALAVLPRIIEKKNEWLKFKEDMKGHWARVVAENR